MSIPVPTEESIKANAKAIRELIKNELAVDVPHGQCLKIVSQLFGFKNWNSAKALVPEQARNQIAGPKVSETAVIVTKTVKELQDVLSQLDPNSPFKIRIDEEYGPDFGKEGNMEGPPATNRQLYFPMIYKVGDQVRVRLALESDAWTLHDGNPDSAEDDDLHDLIRKCLRCIFRQNGITFSVDESYAYLTQRFDFDEQEESYKLGDEAPGYYGVHLITDKHNGFMISDDNGPGNERGNKEGFVDDVRAAFKDQCQSQAFRFFEKYEFFNMEFEWDELHLDVTGKMHLSNPNLERSLRNLLKDDAGREYSR